jgi:hypothetical protein
MEAESSSGAESLIYIVVAWLPLWLPLLFQLAIAIWLILKVIGVLRIMAAAQEGILAKLNDIDRRLAAKGILPPDAT